MGRTLGEFDWARRRQQIDPSGRGQARSPTQADREAETRLNAFHESVVLLQSIVLAARLELAGSDDPHFVMEAITDNRMRLHETRETSDFLVQVYGKWQPGHDLARTALQSQWEGLWDHTEAGRGSAALSYRERVLNRAYRESGLTTRGSPEPCTRYFDVLDTVPRGDRDLLGILLADLRHQAHLVAEREGLLRQLRTLPFTLPLHSREAAHALIEAADRGAARVSIMRRDNARLEDALGLGERLGVGDATANSHSPHANPLRRETSDLARRHVLDPPTGNPRRQSFDPRPAQKRRI